MVAMRSAPMPCGTKPVVRLVSGSAAQAPPSEPMGTRDIDSTPPASTRSSQPLRTFCAATFTASSPEAQNRLSWTPATVSGSPAAIAAVFAMSAPWSPTGETTPSTRSSMSAGSRSACRARSSSSRPMTSETGFTPCNAPLGFPRPRGVRIASNTNASLVMARLPGRHWCELRLTFG
jgi:hypothetical protein